MIYMFLSERPTLKVLSKAGKEIEFTPYYKTSDLEEVELLRKIKWVWELDPDTSTSEIEPNSIVKRDGFGRAKIADPVHETEIANKQFVDGAVQPLDKRITTTENDITEILKKLADVVPSEVGLIQISTHPDIDAVRNTPDGQYYVNANMHSIFPYADLPLAQMTRSRGFASITSYLHYPYKIIVYYNLYNKSVWLMTCDNGVWSDWVQAGADITMLEKRLTEAENEIAKILQELPAGVGHIQISTHPNIGAVRGTPDGQYYIDANMHPMFPYSSLPPTQMARTAGFASIISRSSTDRVIVYCSLYYKAAWMMTCNNGVWSDWTPIGIEIPALAEKSISWYVRIITHPPASDPIYEVVSDLTDLRSAADGYYYTHFAQEHDVFPYYDSGGYGYVGFMHKVTHNNWFGVITWESLANRSVWKMQCFDGTWSDWYRSDRDAILPIEMGGTGADTKDGAGNKLFPAKEDAALTHFAGIIGGVWGRRDIHNVRGDMGLGYTDEALPVANGGTGATTRGDAINKLMPNVSGQVTHIAGFLNGDSEQGGRFAVENIKIGNADRLQGYKANASYEPDTVVVRKENGDIDIRNLNAEEIYIWSENKAITATILKNGYIHAQKFIGDGSGVTNINIKNIIGLEALIYSLLYLLPYTVPSNFTGSAELILLAATTGSVIITRNGVVEIDTNWNASPTDTMQGVVTLTPGDIIGANNYTKYGVTWFLKFIRG